MFLSVWCMLSACCCTACAWPYSNRKQFCQRHLRRFRRSSSGSSGRCRLGLDEYRQGLGSKRLTQRNELAAKARASKKPPSLAHATPKDGFFRPEVRSGIGVRNSGREVLRSASFVDFCTSSDSPSRKSPIGLAYIRGGVGDPRQTSVKHADPLLSQRDGMPPHCYRNVTACHPKVGLHRRSPKEGCFQQKYLRVSAFSAYSCTFGADFRPEFCTRCAEPSPTRKPLCELGLPSREMLSLSGFRWRVRRVWTSIAKGLGANDLCPGSSCREGQRSEKRPMVLHILPEKTGDKAGKRPSAVPREPTFWRGLMHRPLG